MNIPVECIDDSWMLEIKEIYLSEDAIDHETTRKFEDKGVSVKFSDNND